MKEKPTPKGSRDLTKSGQRSVSSLSKGRGAPRERKAKAAKKARVTKASARAAESLATDRTQQIFEMMTSGVWVRGVSSRELAREWAVPHGTVTNLEEAALGWLHKIFSPSDLSIVRARLVAVTEGSLSRSVVAANEKGVMTAIDTMAKLTGVYGWAERSAGAPPRAKVEVHIHAPEPQEKPTDGGEQ